MPSERTLTSADQRISGRLLPCGAADAPLLLCIHGGGCNGLYFQIQGFSVADRALARGFDVLLVDRPGHGLSAPARTNRPITEAADMLPDFLWPILEERTSPDLIIIGHSIGGAVALVLGASGRLPIRALAVSGIGRTPTRTALAWFEQFKVNKAEPPTELFFGPKGSYHWRAPIALRKAVEPWHLAEIHQSLIEWPLHFDAVAAAIHMPVSMHLAEHEGIWQRKELASGALAATFNQAPRVLVGILPHGGHLYELHTHGTQMVDDQLAFLATTCTKV